MTTQSLSVQATSKDAQLKPVRCKRVLIAVDNSNPSHAAVQAGGELAAALSAEVMLLHTVLPELAVLEVPHTQDLLDRVHRDEGVQILERAAQRLSPSLRAQKALAEGNPAEEIIDRAKQWQASFIVMGTRRRGRLSHFLLGSTAEAVIRKAPCPVLTVGDELAASEPVTHPPVALHAVLPAT